jgi:hypothetical protein
MLAVPFARFATAARTLTAAVALLAAASPSVQAQSISTLYAGNNYGNTGGAVYFDALVGINGLMVTGFDINTASTATFSGFQVWLRAGTSQGNQTPAGWSLVATGSGTGAGLNNATEVTLSNTFNLDANTLYGFALVNDPGLEHHYTNGNGSNQIYSNSDLTLTMGSATNAPFNGAPFSPRVWNGTMRYTTSTSVPEPASLALIGFGLVGVAGAARRRSRRTA